MKKIKWLGLFLLLALCLCSVIACNNESEGGHSIDSSRVVGTHWEGVDQFEGMTLKISLSVEQDRNNTSIPHSERYIRGSDTAEEDGVQNLVFDRNKNVRDMLGIGIEYQEVRHQYAAVQQYIDEQVMAATENTPDIFIDDVYGTIRSAMNGNIRNALEVDPTEGENYFVKFGMTEENGWYPEYMNGMTLNPSIYYILAGDYFIDVLREAFVLYVNIDEFESRIGDLGPNLYDEIKLGNWTYDMMAEYADMGWERADRNNSGSAQIEDVCVGFLIDSISVYPFFYASDFSLYNKTPNGTYEVLYENQPYFTFVNAVFDLLTAQAVYRTDEDGKGAAYRSSTLFAAGNVLFAEGMWLSNLESQEIRDMKEKKGVIVYPRYSGSKTYNTFIHDTAEVGSIAMSTNKFSACTAYLQCVTEESGDMIQRYKEFAVKYKYNKDAATVEMIDIIYDSIGSPFEGLMGSLAFELQGGSTSNGVNTPKNHILKCVNAKNNTFVYSYQTSYGAYVAGIEVLQEKFGINP